MIFRLALAAAVVVLAPLVAAQEAGAQDRVLQRSGNSLQVWNGSAWSVAARSPAIGTCAAAETGRTDVVSDDVRYCDGASRWSMRGLDIGACATPSQIGVSATTELSFCSSNGRLYSMERFPAISLTIAANTADYNLNTAARNAGWNGTSPVSVLLTVNSGVEVTASTTATYAMTVSGFPAGSSIEIVNRGTIIGKGGTGAKGTNGQVNGCTAGSPGGTGGNALNAASPLSMQNYGTIAGGGGGGGGGGMCRLYTSTGSGGGGAGYGLRGPNDGCGGATAGQPGTLTTGGAGGPSTSCHSAGGGGGAGGAGGNQGLAGNAGGSADGRAGGAGGAPGSYVVGNANVTWVVPGTRLGGVQ